MTGILFSVLAPIVVLFAILMGKRLRAQQAKRIDDYRRSPKSRLIRLND